MDPHHKELPVIAPKQKIGVLVLELPANNDTEHFVGDIDLEWGTALEGQCFFTKLA